MDTQETAPLKLYHRVRLKTGDGSCTVDEVLTGGRDLPVCVEMDDDNWDSMFLEELGNDQNCEVASWQR